MLRSTIRKRTVRLVLVAGALLALTAGGAYATGVLGSPIGADGVIHGCYQRYNGDLHLTAADTPACPSGQVPIAWSQTGPNGDKGDPGERGAQGERGPQGFEGAQGRAGADGVSGYELTHIDFTVPGTTFATQEASCPGGKKIVGGGAWLFTNPNALDTEPTLVQSAPIDSDTWEVKISNNFSTRSWSYRLQLVCVSA